VVLGLAGIYVKESFLGLCCEIGHNEGAFLGLKYPAVAIGAQLFYLC
jgi:hypothetical protein